MASLKEHFKSDFKLQGIVPYKNAKTFTIGVAGGDNFIIAVEQKAWINFQASTALLTYFIPETESTALICKNILESYDNFVAHMHTISVHTIFKNDNIFGNEKCVYSKRIYIYCQNEPSKQEYASLEKICLEKGLYLTIRSQQYCLDKMEVEVPKAFISHDSRDKDFIARPLALGLSSRLCSVWYDEYSLDVGDSLRESIEKGIKEAKKCILIITPNFLSNHGWGKKEFNSIFTRELIMNEKVVLPIWHKVKPNDVYEYSPSLADTVALTWPDIKDPEKDKKIQILISKIHGKLS